MKIGHIIFLIVLFSIGYAVGARKPSMFPIIGVSGQ